MKKQDQKKKNWSRPEVTMLNIKKDTFSGQSLGPEGKGVGNTSKKA